ncbi:hypothetical protein ACFSSC_08790 [Corynebacterium mendelii]|uniref:Cutinase family protein n=1 Tax=Corynebacterium mendelii TaxID=2765362 RepID=A0A939E3S6_9CORY|nr:hypothetical protein [Corynebacterium mendelii]MBN9645072.1 hypothetical protein [Corynebacterium mendelii]
MAATVSAATAASLLSPAVAAADEAPPAVSAPVPVEAPLLPPAAGTVNECPAAVMLLARGSGQLRLEPARLANGTEVNGWEGETLRPLLERIDTTDIRVHPLAYDQYSANPFWTEPYQAGVRRSAVEGALGAIREAVSYEDATGCRPDYIVVGYSQGAMAMEMAERILALSGRLTGSVYIGDPWLDPFDPALVGTPTGGKGMLFRTGPLFASTSLRLSPDVVEYCEFGDPVCDNTRSFIDQVSLGGATPHLSYFIRERDADRLANEDYVVERINRMTEASRQRKRQKTNAAAVTPLTWRMMVAATPGEINRLWITALFNQALADGVHAADQRLRLVGGALPDGGRTVPATTYGVVGGTTAVTLMSLANAFVDGGVPALAQALSSAPGGLSSGVNALWALSSATVSSPTSVFYGTNLSSWASSDTFLLTTLSVQGSVALSTGSL